MVIMIIQGLHILCSDCNVQNGNLKLRNSSTEIVDLCTKLEMFRDT